MEHRDITDVSGEDSYIAVDETTVNLHMPEDEEIPTTVHKRKVYHIAKGLKFIYEITKYRQEGDGEAERSSNVELGREWSNELFINRNAKNNKRISVNFAYKRELNNCVTGPKSLNVLLPVWDF